MSWMQIEKNVDNLFPQVSADLKNNPDESLQEMVNFDHPEDSAITTDLVFRYFHLLGKKLTNSISTYNFTEFFFRFSRKSENELCQSYQTLAFDECTLPKRKNPP